MKGSSHLARELLDHVPFTVFFGAVGILFAGLLTYMAAVADVQHARPAEVRSGLEQAEPEAPGEAHKHAQEYAPGGGETVRLTSVIIFHVFHPVHMLFSAIATTAMFWRYDRKLWKAIVTGFVGSAGVCGVSDVALPYLGGWLLETRMEFHWCLIQHPQLVVPFLAMGILGGLMAEQAIGRSTVYSHSGHVFVSSVASIFYMISFGLADWVGQVGYVFIIMVVAVLFPCCFSDIIFPLLLAQPEKYVGDHAH